MAIKAEDTMKALLSGLLGTALGITITYMTGVSSNRTEIVRLSTLIENLTTQVKTDMTDRYRGSDATKDHAVINEKIHDIQLANRELKAILMAHRELDKQLDAEFRAHVVYCERNRGKE